MAKTTKVTKATETKTTTATKTAPVAAATKAVAAKKPEEKPVAKVEEKKPAAKAEENKPAAKNTTAKKSAAKKPAAKRAKKPVEKIQEVFVEYNGEQFLTGEIVEKIHEQYRAEGHRVGAIKSLRVYIDPAERRAYYVINDKAEGKFVAF